jgi:hypothetical protein
MWTTECCVPLAKTEFKIFLVRQTYKKLKKYTSDIKESGIRLFFGPKGLSYAPFATSGGMKLVKNPWLSLYSDN